MKKNLLIIRSNLRKSKGQTFGIVVLILLAAIMLNLWLMLSLDYKKNFDRYHDKLNAEHVTLVVDNQTVEFRNYMNKILQEKAEISEYRFDNCMHMVGTFPYNQGTINSEFVFMDKNIAVEKEIGKTEIVEETKYTSGVYLPMLYKSKELKTGNTIEITIGSHTITYVICGFFNSIMMGSHNCSVTQILLTTDQYDELSKLNYAPYATVCSIRLKNKAKSAMIEAELKSLVSEQFSDDRLASNCYRIVSQARYISQGICSIILSVMAFLILLISLVIIISNIINYIQTNMKNLGVLKAIGYTSKQMIGTLLLQFLGITLCVAILGTALAYALFPMLNTMMISQTGIPYAISFLPLPMVISLLILGGTVAGAVVLAAYRIHKLEPILALRFGIQTHSFKKNVIPLEKTKFPLNLALSLKMTCSNIKHNITICITMLVLSLVIVFSELMIENVILDMSPFLNLIVGETADSCINVQTEAEVDFLKSIQTDQRVEKAYLYTSLTVSHSEGVELMVTICDDFEKVNNQNVVFQGRFPKYENEIAIAAKYAKEINHKIGDEIKITSSGVTKTFLICGFTQITNNLGRDCLLTRKGYEQFGKLTNVSYYLNLKAGTDINQFNIEIKNQFLDQVNTTINIDETIQASGRVYIQLMTIIVVAILILSVIVIVFVLYLLVRTLINNYKQDYGILKATGFTTRQLIVQLALSFMPAILISTILGVLISSFVINPLMSLFLSTMGIVKCTFKIPVLFSFFAGVGMILLSFVFSCLLSFKIKKITPHTLLANE